MEILCVSDTGDGTARHLQLPNAMESCYYLSDSEYALLLFVNIKDAYYLASPFYILSTLNLPFQRKHHKSLV